MEAFKRPEWVEVSLEAPSWMQKCCKLIDDIKLWSIWRFGFLDDDDEEEDNDNADDADADG